jgi:hypothetical protein
MEDDVLIHWNWGLAPKRSEKDRHVIYHYFRCGTVLPTLKKIQGLMYIHII